MNNKYYLFSDESGHWARPKEFRFYCRSWVLFSEDNYIWLEAFWKQKKIQLPTQKSIMKNIDVILKKGQPKFFFTFTKLDEFYLRKWNIRDAVSLALSQLENSIKRKYEVKIPSKIKTALNQVLFLHVYEKFHIENAIQYLGLNHSTKYEFHLNKPQFAEDDYLEVFNEMKGKLGIDAKISFVKNKENELGVKLADSLAKLFFKIIQEDDKKSLSLLKRKIFPSSVLGGLGIKGINKILSPVNKSYGNDKLRLEEVNLINRLRDKFS